jgi:hypothetical protein
MENWKGKVYTYAIAVERGDELLPFFGEYPVFVWGIDKPFYDSDGDCKTPKDRDWHALDFGNRLTHVGLAIRHQRSESQSRAFDEARQLLRSLGRDRVFQMIREIGPPATRIYIVSASDLLTAQRAAYLTALRSGGFVLQDEQRRTPEAFADTIHDLWEHMAQTDEVQSEFVHRIAASW